MLMNSLADLDVASASFGVFPELAGKRVLITGVTGRNGIDIVRAFAEHRARLVLQIDETCVETQALLETIAPLAIDLTVTSDHLADAEAVIRFGRASIAEYAGIDVVINLIELTPGIAAIGTIDAVEERIAGLFMLPSLVARIAANRMRVLRTDGLVLNIAVLPARAEASDIAFAAAAKATLAAMTRREAQTWAPEGVRFNAVAPAILSGLSRGLSGEADVAALALHLAAGRGGTSLNGQVFEADPIWTR